MISNYPGHKLKALRKRAMLSQMEVVELTGISETTIKYLEHEERRPRTRTLNTLLNLYAIRIKRLEGFDQVWGEDGLQKATVGPIQSAGVVKGNGTPSSHNQTSTPARTPGCRVPDHPPSNAERVRKQWQATQVRQGDLSHAK